MELLLIEGSGGELGAGAGAGEWDAALSGRVGLPLLVQGVAVQLCYDELSLRLLQRGEEALAHAVPCEVVALPGLRLAVPRLRHEQLQRRLHHHQQSRQERQRRQREGHEVGLLKESVERIGCAEDGTDTAA